MNYLFSSWLWGVDEKTRQSYLKQEEDVRDIYLSFYSLINIPDEALLFSLSRKGLLWISSKVRSLTQKSPDFTIQKQVEDYKALRSQLSTLLFSGKADKQSIQTLEEKSNSLERRLS
jgi:hypothetical protein